MDKLFVDPDISRARTISTHVYKSPEVFESAKENIFAASWQLAGDTDMVKSPGSCYPFTFLEKFIDEPLLLTRDENGGLHCLSNVCTHRGNLLVYESCRLTNLRCKYHGRLFHLNGQFKSMPEFKEVKDFPSTDDNLNDLPLFQWGKLLFTSLNQRYEPSVFFKDVMERVAWLPLEEFYCRPDLARDYYIDANWALYCENYLEGFHIPFVHAGLNAAIDFTGYSTELFYPFSSLQIGISKTGESFFDLPASSPDHGKKVAAYYFWVFPNMMFNFMNCWPGSSSKNIGHRLHRFSKRGCRRHPLVL